MVIQILEGCLSSFRVMFYFFFESRNIMKDPVVIWLTRGPGCSSELAVFYENGPFEIAKKSGMTMAGIRHQTLSLLTSPLELVLVPVLINVTFVMKKPVPVLINVTFVTKNRVLVMICMTSCRYIYF